MAIDMAAINGSIARHAKKPDISIEDYVHDLRVSLGLEVSNKKKIYLDKRYWIFIREAHMGRARKSIHMDLLSKLREFVDSKNGICPISESLFCELNKQTDIKTRRATAELIDELSLGVSLCPFYERVGTEIANFIYKAGGLEVYKLNELVWLKLSYTLGVIWPSISSLEKETEKLIQKAFTEHMWNISLVEVIDALAKGENIDPPTFDDLAKNLNVNNAAHSEEITNFEQAYLAEISGGFSLFKSVAVDILDGLFLKTTGQRSCISMEERTKYENELHVYFVNLFKSGKVSKQLPSLHVHAKCHAAIRCDKQRKIKSNDIYDFQHAAGAVGYCDAFFTENPLKILLTSRHVALDREIGCTVISDEIEAVKYLEAS